MYVIQTKVDSKGECYAIALQNLLTGVYLSELCLIGLFGIRKASGPSTLMIILLILTVIHHVFLNRLLRPLELYLPANDEEEEAPLLSAEEGTLLEGEAEPSSLRAQRLGLHKLPGTVSGRIAKFLESHISASRNTAKAWLHDPASREDTEVPTYTEEEMRTAYLNPALTSKTPKLWLVRDEMGISKHEIEENEAVGIPSTDEGAFFDSENHVRWAQDDFHKVPIFKMHIAF